MMRLSLAAVILLTGCYKPTYPEQFKCSTAYPDCPEGQQCAFGRGVCVPAGSKLDAAPPDIPAAERGPGRNTPARPDLSPDRWIFDAAPPNIPPVDMRVADTSAPQKDTSATGTSWVRSWGDSDNETARAVAMDPSGATYILGQYRGTVDFGGFQLTSVKNSSGSSTIDIVVLKVSPAGTVVWAVSAGGPGLDRGNAMVLDKNKQVYIAGKTTPGATFGAIKPKNFYGHDDWFVARLSPTKGAFSWVEIGGSSGWYEDATALAVRPGSDDIYVTGTHGSKATFGGKTISHFGGKDIFVARMQSSGKVVWTNNAGGLASEMGKGIIVDSTHVYITGYFYGTARFGSVKTLKVKTSNSNDADIFVAALTYGLGKWAWANRAGGAYFDSGNAVVIHPVAPNRPVVAGYFSTTATFDDGSSKGIVRTSAGHEDVFVAEVYKSSGNFVTVSTAGGTGSDTAEALAVDGLKQHVMVTGTFGGDATFGKLKAIHTAGSSKDSPDIFLARYKTTTGFDWLHTAGGTSWDLAEDVAVDPGRRVVVTGYYTGNLSFGASMLLKSKGNSDDLYLWSLPTP